MFALAIHSYSDAPCRHSLKPARPRRGAEPGCERSQHCQHSFRLWGRAVRQRDPRITREFHILPSFRGPVAAVLTGSLSASLKAQEAHWRSRRRPVPQGQNIAMPVCTQTGASDMANSQRGQCTPVRTALSVELRFCVGNQARLAATACHARWSHRVVPQAGAGVPGEPAHGERQQPQERRQPGGRRVARSSLAQPPELPSWNPAEL